MFRSFLQPIFFLRLALFISFIYHGLWNLSSAGAEWWKMDSGLPFSLRYGVGGLELLIALFLFLDRNLRFSGLATMLLMFGAVIEHLKFGFSFKQNGFETPLVYFFLGAALLCSKEQLKKYGHRK